MQDPASIKLLSPAAMIMNFLYLPFILFLNSNGQQISILILLMTIDFITGTMKSNRLGKGFTPEKFARGAYAKFVTLLLPFVLAFTAQGVGYTQISEFIPFCLSTLVLIETYSILGNMYTVKKGIELEDKDIFSFLILTLRAIIVKEIKPKKKD